jgi:hypothetical protein
MGYYAISPQDADILRAEHEADYKENAMLGTIIASIAVVSSLVFVLSALLGWGDGALLVSLVAFVVAGLCATITYVGAWDAKNRQRAVRTEWVDTEQYVTERV